MKQVAVDPVTLEVMRNALYSVTDEMAAALIRTAHSTNIKDRRDCSSAVYTPDGEVVAQSEVATPLHLGVMPAVVRTVLGRYPASALEQGDDVVINEPYPAGPGHLNDVTLVSPVFYRGELVALVANQAHHVDVGGYAPGSMPFGVHEVYQEGLQIPPVKLVKRDAVDEEIMAFISHNVRTKAESRGDLLAQVAANNVGERRLLEVIDRVGLDTFLRYLAEMMDYAERRMIAGIRALPAGTYAFEDYLEGTGFDDELIRIRAAVTVGDGRVAVDFAGTSPQVRGPINCRLPSVQACVYYVVKAIVDPGLPPNSGAYRPISVSAPEGSLLNARFPAAVAHSNIVTSQRIVDVLLGALLEAAPDRVGAACSGTENLLIIGGIHPATGRPFNYVETYGGGQGALPDGDGMSGVHTHMTNTRNAPVEAIEQSYPLRVEAYGLVPNSEGPGRWRGGFGMMRRVVTLAEATLTLSSDRARLRPWGVLGGGEAAPARALLQSADAAAAELPSKVTMSLPPGSDITTITPGGGGLGDPRERDPSLVRLDVEEGLISPQRAQREYGR